MDNTLKWTSMARQDLYPIRVVSGQTGLSTHVIRVWERRYRAITPSRSGTNRRLYSTGDIDRLLLLQRTLAAGYSIGQVASFPESTLKKLAAGVPPHKRRQAVVRQHELAPDKYVASALGAAGRMDERAIESHLVAASIALSPAVLLEKVIAPLIEQVGEQWHEGRLRPVQEHLATAVIRSFLTRMKDDSDCLDGPQMIVATLAGDLHDLGALLAAATAGSLGWRVIFLGASLPAEEIAAAAWTVGADAVALSLVYLPRELQVVDDLRRLAKRLPPETRFVVGGRNAREHAKLMEELGGLAFHSLSSFRNGLGRLDVPARRTPSGPRLDRLRLPRA